MGNLILLVFFSIVFELSYSMVSVADSGDVFGWGNSEYSQLDRVAPGLTQVATPKHLNLQNIVGKVVDVAATGSSCAVVNGEKT